MSPFDTAAVLTRRFRDEGSFVVLVTGGRDYLDFLSVEAAMTSLPLTPTLVIHGGAKGADSLAGRWARECGVHTASVPALWGDHGKAAGHIRNRIMLGLCPDYCVAFPGGKGTEGMVSLCEAAGVPVWRPYA